MVREKGKAKLLGVGLDNKDEHVRVTRGKNFHLVGGSHETHENMQEKCIKLDEKLHERGKELHDVEEKELLDLAQECNIDIANLKRPTSGR